MFSIILLIAICASSYVCPMKVTHNRCSDGSGQMEYAKVLRMDIMPCSKVPCVVTPNNLYHKTVSFESDFDGPVTNIDVSMDFMDQMYTIGSGEACPHMEIIDGDTDGDRCTLNKGGRYTVHNRMYPPSYEDMLGYQKNPSAGRSDLSSKPEPVSKPEPSTQLYIPQLTLTSGSMSILCVYTDDMKFVPATT
ncbi:Uncharacterised protein g5776 [Pycnogonum litorale]